MKIPLISCGLLVGVLWAAANAAPAPSPSPSPSASPLEKTPLPSGPLVAKMPDFAAWRISFSYLSDKPPSKPGERPDAPPSKPGDGIMTPARGIVVTRTTPYCHVALQDTAGRTSELWYDGGFTYLQTPGHTAPYLPGSNPDGSAAIPHYLDFTRTDFPDLEWVSAKTYIGSLKGETNTFLVFKQNEAGPTVWIDLDTRHPIRWQNTEGEVRKFEYLDAPTEKLVLPPEVLQLSKLFHRSDAALRRPRPRGS